MGKKRVTLVDNFDDIVQNGNLEEFKAIYDKCDINASKRALHKNALHYVCGMTDEMFWWLIDNGCDVEQRDSRGMTPLMSQASKAGGRCDILIKAGADVNAVSRDGHTALWHAASAWYDNSEQIKWLLDAGADPDAKDFSGRNVLEAALNNASNITIKTLPSVVKLLLKSEVDITEKMRESVRVIGERFEFYRNEFNKDYLVETDAALLELYTIFAVEPVPHRKVYDGVSEIKVDATEWTKQFNELWDMLVPGKGHANTVQGEVIRICGRISHEILDNGAYNWDNEFKKMCHALSDYIELGKNADCSVMAELKMIISGIGSGSDKKSIYRLTELAVSWVLSNPMPFKLEKVNYKR